MRRADHAYTTASRLWLWLAVLAATFGLARAAEAQVADRAFRRTAAQLSALSPNETNQRRFYICSDCASTASCTVGGGSTENLCKWNGLAWGVVGSGAAAPTGASYFTLGLDGTLSAERVFTPGLMLSGVDGGANSTYTLNLAGSSANLASALTNETGTGVAVFSDSPAFTSDPTIAGVSICREDGTNCPTATASGGGEYHIDNPPVSVGTGGCAEEFTAGSEQCTWAWGNEGTTGVDSLIQYGHDAILFQVLDTAGGASVINMRGRWQAVPASGDWAFAIKMTEHLTRDLVDQCGIWIEVVADGGDGGTDPDSIRLWSLENDATNVDLVNRLCTSYSSCAALTASIDNASPEQFGAATVSTLAVHFTDSSNTLSLMWGTNNLAVPRLTVQTSNVESANPARAGFYCSGDATTAGQPAVMGLVWARLIIDASPPAIINYWDFGD